MPFETKPDGIYFDLPDSEYHREPRLSASGIQNMMVSPATFWANSWLNPDKFAETADGDPADEEATKAQILGKAYHTARLEPEKFDRLYCAEIDKADYAGAKGFLSTDAEIKDKLKELGEPQSKTGEGVLERAERLKAAGYPYKIWHIEKATAEETYAGRIAINGKYFKDLMRDMEIIHGNPEISKHLTGGFAEVSVFWTDKRTGVKMKARMDYLKPEQYTDFKTFDNKRGKELEAKIADDFRYNRYYIQAALYWQVCEVIRGVDLPEIYVHGSEEQFRFIESIRARKTPLDAWFVFQEKNGVPNLLAREIELMRSDKANDVNDAGADPETSAKVAAMTYKPTALYAKAKTEIDHFIGMFKFYMEEFGEARPWAPLRPTGKLTDDNFSQYWLENDA